MRLVLAVMGDGNPEAAYETLYATLLGWTSTSVQKSVFPELIGLVFSLQLPEQETHDFSQAFDLFADRLSSGMTR